MSTSHKTTYLLSNKSKVSTMSRKIYLQELEAEAARKAREARVAFSATAAAMSNDEPRALEDELFMEVFEQGKAALKRIRETALIPFHAAVSKPAQKAYLGTFLLAATSLFLLGLSTAAYALFYYNFVPQVRVERTVHLQFGNGHPYGTARLDSSLTSLQPYEVSLLLHLPRTPNNLAAGNFMLDLSLLSPPKGNRPATIPTPVGAIPPVLGEDGPTPHKLAHSRRPAILTYASLITDTASTLTGLPWYMLGWKTESEVLEVSMFEDIQFSRGSGNVPQELKLVVEADEKMQFYEVGVRIVARFGGLRWIMYHHRILSYVIFTSIFWSSSMISAVIAWLVLASYLSSDSTGVKKEEAMSPTIKTEPSESEPHEPSLTEGLSDTSRTFPTLGRHMPLHFTGRAEGDDRQGEEQVKQEEDVMQTTGVQPLIAEADDEDEGAETTGFRDSGIGTSLEEDRREQVQRRRKALFGNRQ
ncbi:MAG: hypothetical protein LQ338_006627 [Usnochroma carphineum]|nr:MAG: hypothetical protein LQ338_006627 [Usnochroma carphineum]